MRRQRTRRALNSRGRNRRKNLDVASFITHNTLLHTPHYDSIEYHIVYIRETYFELKICIYPSNTVLSVVVQSTYANMFVRMLWGVC